MTESNLQPRRSARSTKGQHRSRSDDVTLPVVVKKKEKPDDNDDKNNEDTVRCICGKQDDDGRLFVQCDQCHVWQHPDCMLGITKEKDIPDEYFCEQCRPDLYPNLVKQDQELKSKSKSKSPEVPLKDDQKVVDNKPSPKQEQPITEVENEPPKQTSASPLSPKTAPREEDDASQPEPSNGGEESDGEYKEPTATGGEKRKSLSPEDGSSDSDQRASKSARRGSGTSAEVTNNNNKKRRQSSAANAELVVESIDELKDKVRNSVAKALVGIFEKIAPQEEKAAIGLSLEIENALYNGFATKKAKEVGQKYRDKFRSLSFNLKDTKNPIGKRVIDGQISPQQLVHMSSDEMRNPELQKLAEHVRQESISQSVLKQDEMPRIRRTHKGEELVETDDILPASEVSGPAIQPQDAVNVVITQDSEKEPEPVIYDPSLSPEGPVTPGNESASDVEEERQQEKGSMAAIHDEEDGQGGTDDAQLVVPPSPPEQQQSSMSDEKMGGNGMIKNADADDDDYDDIDRLINDNIDTRKTVWSGHIEMPGIAEFQAHGAQLSGPRILDEELWSEILPTQLFVDGRLPKDTGDGYLSSVAAASKELVGVIFSPDSEFKQTYNKLYEYFLTRSRYGVIRNRPGGPIKDGYIIPIGEWKDLPGYLHISSTSLQQQQQQLDGVNGWLIYVGVMARPVASFYYSKQRDCNHQPIMPPESMETVQRLNLPPDDLKTLVHILMEDYKPFLSNNIVLSNPAALSVLVEQYRNKRL